MVCIVLDEESEDDLEIAVTLKKEADGNSMSKVPRTDSAMKIDTFFNKSIERGKSCKIPWKTKTVKAQRAKLEKTFLDHIGVYNVLKALVKSQFSNFFWTARQKWWRWDKNKN